MRQIFLILTLVCTFYGCSSGSSKPYLKPAEVTNNNNFEDSSIQVNESQGYDLNIINETNDGKFLSIVFKVESNPSTIYASTLNSKSMSILLSIYAEGRELLNLNSPIADLMLLDNYELVGNKPLAEFVGKELLVQVKLPDQGALSDYQMTLKWGEDKELIGSKLVRQVRFKSGAEICQNQVCGTSYELQLEMYNPFDKAVHLIEVETWYAKSKYSSRDTISIEPSVSDVNKDILMLDGVTIEPKQAVAVVLHFSDPLLNDLAKEGFVPQYRVKGFEFIDSSM